MTEPSWTVMVYLAGDNNLTEEMVWALQELKSWSSNGLPSPRIVAQFDPSGAGIPTQRYDFGKHAPGSPPVDGDLEYWREPPSQALDETNTGNPNALKEFILWGAKRHNASHYAVILSGHGSGTTEDFLLKDENSIDSMSIPELKEALNGALGEMGKAGCAPLSGKFDILGMDCCFMSMVEVCHSLKNIAGIVIGAEGYEPEAGWPYHRILQALAGSPGKYWNAEELAKLIVEKYVLYYSDFDLSAGRSSDLAAIDLDKMEVKGPLNDLAANLNRLIAPENPAHEAAREQITLAHWEAQTYKFDQFVDLKDFCLCLQERERKFLHDRPLRDACSALITAVDNCVVLAGCSGFAYQHSYGLSIYFPWSALSPAYEKMELVNGTAWFAFLEDYLEKSRRRPRNGFLERPGTCRKADEDAQEAAELALLRGFVRSLGADPDPLVPRLQEKLKAARPLGRPLLGSTPLGSVGGGHRYDRSRYDRSRYDRSRYDRSRYSDERDRWAKNPPIGSGIAWSPKAP
jgi:hypothetical protein